ncbi:MAG: SAM-dependent methyltransferase [Verrucomicrobiota bacterium]
MQFEPKSKSQNASAGPTGEPALVDFIRDTIRRRGAVSFAWFMEQALYHPRYGYYSSGRCAIGCRGDYFTNVSVGPLFGRLLATQFAEMWNSLGQPDDFTVVEQGAHDGAFAHDVLAAARERAPDFFAALRYRIVEPFPILRAKQTEALRGLEEKVVWTNALDDLEPFSGVHFSNELLDAMPVHLLRRSGCEWQELHVTEADGELVFVSRPIADEKLLRQVRKIPRSAVEPYETEVNLATLDWLEILSQKLIRGYVLAVDYGYARDEFYSPTRTSGTLRSYARHRINPSPLHEIGHADISAQVDWTSLAERAEECGLTLAGFTDQHHFITGLISRTDFSVANETRALQTLLHPELLGTAFQFLALVKNASPNQLTGFRFARDPRAMLGLR